MHMGKPKIACHTGVSLWNAISPIQSMVSKSKDNVEGPEQQIEDNAALGTQGGG